MSIKVEIGNKVKPGTYTIVSKNVVAKQLEPDRSFFLKDKNDFLYYLKIEHDLYPTNPRLEDNICTFMGNPEIADEGAPTTRKEIDKVLSAGVYYKKIFMYDHSGRTISLNPFADEWDSGFVGYIYVDQNKLREEGLDPFDLELVTKIMDAEIKEYNNYLAKEVYTFAIYRAVTGVKQNKPWANAEYTTNDILFDEFYRPVFYGDKFAENGLMQEIPEDFEFVEQILTENDDESLAKLKPELEETGYFVEATDERRPDLHDIWQSETYEDRAVALKAGRRLAQALYRSDLKIMQNTGFLNPNWPVSGKGVKHFLHVYLMRKGFASSEIDSQLK